MLVVEYSEKDFALLQKEKDNNSSSIVRNRCLVLILKMQEPKMSCERIADIVNCCRNFVMKWIHTYNKKGIKAVLEILPKPGRPGKLKNHISQIDYEWENTVLTSANQARDIIEKKFDIKVSESRTIQLLHQLGYRFIKMQPIPGKADPEKQKEWLNAFESTIKEAKEGKIKLYFMDAVHFTLEAFTCYSWTKNPVYLPSGAGRNRLNLVGAIDPLSMKLIKTHSMKYVGANEIIEFLEEVKKESGDSPISIVLDNARYQHCNAVKEVAKKLGINLLFLPPYSPNLNIIERLWKYARKVVLAGKYFPSPEDFHDALKHFFDVDFPNHTSKLSSLLTLNFQSFENAQIIRA